jgi:glutamate formiminotransferase/glutamate formiminotransferase/formiminotetrahydrofolate cyclodeaminase
MLVAARAPLIAFNVELAPPATLADARAIAARIREGGEEGLPGVRAIGLRLERGGIVQVSTNVEDFMAASPAHVVGPWAATRRSPPRSWSRSRPGRRWRTSPPTSRSATAR